MKPILFNTDMVRAILEGRKTVTRRVVKSQHLRVLDSPYHRQHPETPDKVLLERLCAPPYRPGDILYVRETFFECGGHFYYKADGKHKALEKLGIRFKWRPSIHMPREAARIFLRVTDVRVERLQDITEEQAQAEGLYKWWQSTEKSTPASTARQAFMWVWDMTIKTSDRAIYGWIGNPWVWVIEFERCEKPKEEQS